MSIKADTATGETMLAREPQQRAMTIRDLLRNTSGLILPRVGIRRLRDRKHDDPLALQDASRVRARQDPGRFRRQPWHLAASAPAWRGLGIWMGIRRAGSGYRGGIGPSFLTRFVDSRVLSTAAYDRHRVLPPAAKLDRLVDPITRARPPTSGTSYQGAVDCLSGGGGMGVDRRRPFAVLARCCRMGASSTVSGF